MELSTAFLGGRPGPRFAGLSGAFLAFGPRGKRAVSGSHFPQPVALHRHLLHPLLARTSAMELSTAGTLGFGCFLGRPGPRFCTIGALIVFFLAPGPRGRRAVSGSHLPQPPALQRHLLQPLLTNTSAMELSTVGAASGLEGAVFTFFVGGGQSCSFGGRPRRFFCGCWFSLPWTAHSLVTGRNGMRAAAEGVKLAAKGVDASGVTFSTAVGSSSRCKNKGGGSSTSCRFINGCQRGPGVHDSMAGVMAYGVGAYIGVVAKFGPGVKAYALQGLCCSTSSPSSSFPSASGSLQSVACTLSSG